MAKIKEYNGTPENEIFAARLSDAILNSGLTHKTLGVECGLSDGAISNYVTGKKAPSYLAFQRLAKTLGVSYEYLFGEVTAKKASNKEISKRLGLSDEAISNLEGIMQRFEKNGEKAPREINELIKRDLFLSFIRDIHSMKAVESDSVANERAKNLQNLLGKQELWEYYRQHAMKTIDGIITIISPRPTEDAVGVAAEEF